MSAAQLNPAVDMRDFDMRGKLAASLKCWHRLTEEESDQLVAFFVAEEAAQTTTLELSGMQLAQLADAHFYEGMRPLLVHYVAFARAAIAKATGAQQ